MRLFSKTVKRIFQLPEQSVLFTFKFVEDGAVLAAEATTKLDASFDSYDLLKSAKYWEALTLFFDGAGASARHNKARRWREIVFSQLQAKWPPVILYSGIVDFYHRRIRSDPANKVRAYLWSRLSCPDENTDSIISALKLSKTEIRTFRKLLNQNQDIPPEVARVHGYTREILERDGESPQEVYTAFADYAGSRPLVSYHLKYDLDDVLQPEWKRLNVAPIGHAGFCALRLAQRLLDPVPAGNCKLQTLRQYYRLPERGAHTGAGDVATVADLLAQVLRPIAEQRGLATWEQVVAYVAQEWHPTRLIFGKFKGQSFWQAKDNREVRGWLTWLADSTSPRMARMGAWYLRQLAGLVAEVPAAAVPTGVLPADRSAPSSAAVVIYINPEIATLREWVATARARLAELEAAYTSEKARVDALQAELFKRLRSHYQKRDRLRLIIKYRAAYRETVLSWRFWRPQTN